MKKIFLALGAFLLLASNGFAQLGTHLGVTETPWSARDLTSALGTSSTYSISLKNSATNTFSWQISYSAAPTTISISLEASTDCSNYFTADTAISNSGEIRSITGAYKCIRFNNTAVTGGAGKNLTLSFYYTTGGSLPGYVNSVKLLIRTLTIAEVTSSWTTPIQLLPAVTGYSWMPLHGSLTRKSPGTIYATQPGRCKLHWRTGVVGASSALDLSTTFLTSPAPVGGNAAIAWGAPGHVTLNQTEGASSNGASQPLYFYCDTADPTVDVTNTGSDLTLWMYYTQLPVYQSNAR